MSLSVKTRILLLLVLVLAGLLEHEARGDETVRPNIVFFFIDDMGYADPGCFGNPAMKTPNMDRLAADGIRLTSFYVNSPICSASRVALTTGRYQQRYRIHSYLAAHQDNLNRKMPDWLDPTVVTLAKLLKLHGYRTAHFGKWHMGGGRDVGDAPLPQEYGFEESLVSFEGLGDRILWSKKGNQKQSWEHGRGRILSLPKHKTTETYVDRAIRFIERYRDQPFYVRVFPNDVHDAHLPADRQLEKWKGTSQNPPDEKFFAVLDHMDQQIGRVIDTIDRLGLAQNTLILLTSDNGPTDWPHYYRDNVQPPGFTGLFFGRKWSLYEGGIRMPFIARWPGRIPAGSTNDTSIVAAMDLLPSLARLTGCPLPDGVVFDGQDMSRAILGDPIERATPVCWEYGVHGSIQPGKVEHISPHLAIRDGDWKLLCNPDGSDVKLFQLTEDPGETQNLAEQRTDVSTRLQSRLLQWWSEMNEYYATAK